MLKKEVNFGVFIATKIPQNEKLNSLFIYCIKHQYLHGSNVSFP